MHSGAGVAPRGAWEVMPTVCDMCPSCAHPAAVQGTHARGFRRVCLVCGTTSLSWADMTRTVPPAWGQRWELLPLRLLELLLVLTHLFLQVLIH